MNLEYHTLNALFAQLGLPSDDDSINLFVKDHALDKDVRIDQAAFWPSNKAEFLRECIQQDSDWALVVDQLEERLHN